MSWIDASLFPGVYDLCIKHAIRDNAVLPVLFLGTLVAFAGGLLLFGERSNWQKITAVLGILAGIVLTVTG
ncbi:MAG TPA: hypothetical protein VN784_10870 [Candidatus Limnocylindrales bacterium]|nr:hypothetical protein [Candidatus Limnocylindrales bacterium]